MLKSKKKITTPFILLKMLHYVKKYKKVHFFGIVATVMTHTIKLMSYLFSTVNAVKNKTKTMPELLAIVHPGSQKSNKRG